MENLYTSSRLKVLRACLRLHYYRYRLGISEPSSESARFGTAAHSALEAWFRAWKRGDLDARLPAALAAVNASDIHPYDKVRLRALVIAYHTRWANECWTVIDVEIEFRYQLGENLIGGKIDAIVRDADGRIWVVEHKTTRQDASAGSIYWSRLSLDEQVSIYIDGATMLGHEVAGVIYDVLQKPRHDLLAATPMDSRRYTVGKGCGRCGGSSKSGAVKQGRGYIDVVFASEVKRPVCDPCKGTGWLVAPRLDARQRATDETLEEFEDRIVESIAEAPDDYLIRGVVVRLEDELPRMRQDIEDAIKIERATALFDLHPRNPDSCARFGSLCHFYDACSSRASIDDETRFPRGTAHPELAAA